jgi:methionyl-tRNA formyltransferase
MRIVFIATGDIALPAFRQLLTKGPRPLALVTQPDKPSGRHQALTPPAIKIEALAAGIPVFQPEKIGDITAELAALDPEILVVMAYGQILRKNILTLASKAIINLHASLLPKYRGAACIQAAIDAGDAETGITAMHVVRELDAGDVILSRSIDISAVETGGSLHDRLAELAVEVLEEALIQLEAGSAPRIPQDPALVSYIPKLERDDGRIDWSQPATAIERRIRAYDPWPGTFTLAVSHAKGQGAVSDSPTPSTKEKRLKIFPPTTVLEMNLSPGEVVFLDGKWLVGCGQGVLQLHAVQPEGSKRMPAPDYFRGAPTSRFH